MGPRSGQNAVAKRNDLSPSWELNPGRPVRSLVTILTELPRSRTDVICDFGLSRRLNSMKFFRAISRIRRLYETDVSRTISVS
jgi:hypothetical protein